MKVLSYFFPHRIHQSSSKYNKKIEVIESYGTKQLLVNDIVQTGSYPDKIFTAGLRTLSAWHFGPMRRILVFGIGGGSIFAKLRRLYPDADITGIDIDPEIIKISKEVFDAGKDLKVHLIAADARTYARMHREENGMFDIIILDLYIGNDVPDFVTSLHFLISLKQLLRSNGGVMLNYFSFQDQSAKSAQIEKVIRTVYSEVVMQPNLRNMFYFFR